jgi:putative RNA 2'-phosphotransferase
MKRIEFYKVNDPYGELSNFAPFPIMIDGKRWPTTEHYFQAQKFPGTDREDAIRRATSPMIAARMGRSREYPLRHDWEQAKDQIMHQAVLAKFTQYAELRDLLLATGDAEIVEHTQNDSYWGDGGDGKGENKLGKILMQIREELRHVSSTPGAVACTSSSIANTKTTGNGNPMNKQLSKFLSFVLRHKPQAIGITLDAEGWVAVDELLAAAARHRQPVSRQQLEEVVATNDKKRFSFSPDGRLIRANQGHSIKVDLGLVPVEPPELLYHGTVARFLDSIRQEGLVRGNRHHVHLSADRETAARVGQRRGRPVVLVIEAGRMRGDGHAFYKSENAVWLTEAVPPGYLRFPKER